jgi:hypothetical protein
MVHESFDVREERVVRGLGVEGWVALWEVFRTLFDSDVSNDCVVFYGYLEKCTGVFTSVYIVQ